MRLMIVGSDQVWALERHYLKHLKAVNPDTVLFPAPSMAYTYLNHSNWRKLLHRLHLSPIFTQINAQLHTAIEEFNPDVLLVFKGMEIFPETLNWAKSKGIKLANYNPDSPFVFNSRGNGNENITRSFPLFHIHFTYSQRILDKIRQEFSLPAFLLPFAYELDTIIYQQATQLDEKLQVCFVGNPNKERVAFLKQLSKYGLEVDVFGNGWSRVLLSKGFRTFPAVYDEDFWYTVRKYRVQLNMLRDHNVGSHNMRSFEIPAVGGVQLATDSWEHRHFFEVDREIFLFRSLEECREKSLGLLALSANEVNGIRMAARNRCLQSGYSYQKRAESVFNVLRSL